MPSNFISIKAISTAVSNLRCTADAMLKVWLTLKQMGLSEDKTIIIDTKNSESAVGRLFAYGGEKFFVPFACTPSDLQMAHDASRSHIQTNIKKFHDRTVGFDPNTYLKISQRVDKNWEVGLQPNYPQGLGYGKNGFARGDGQKVAIPIRAWAAWYGRKTPVPDNEANPTEYLVENMLQQMNIDVSERAAIFRDDAEFVLELVSTCVSDADLQSLVSNAITTGADDAPVYAIDEQKYLRRLFSVRTPNTGPRWLREEPAKKLKAAIDGGAKAVLLYGPPRTGKTKAVDDLVPRTAATRTTIQIHDGWGYEHLMLGIKAKDNTFDWVAGPLLKAIRGGQKTVVLEEANRTRLSQALGELFSLIESKYRGKQNEVQLRDGSLFHVPEDVTFFLTLNTLDTSTEEIDDALLGRVAAVEFPPRVEDLRSLLRNNGIKEQAIDSISEFFAGLLPSYQLGHGYFAPLKADSDLLHFYQSQIRPVLQKHFRHDSATLSSIDLLADEFFRRT